MGRDALVGVARTAVRETRTGGIPLASWFSLDEQQAKKALHDLREYPYPEHSGNSDERVQLWLHDIWNQTHRDVDKMRYTRYTVGMERLRPPEEASDISCPVRDTKPAMGMIAWLRTVRRRLMPDKVLLNTENVRESTWQLVMNLCHPNDWGKPIHEATHALSTRTEVPRSLLMMSNMTGWMPARIKVFNETSVADRVLLLNLGQRIRTISKGIIGPGGVALDGDTNEVIERVTELLDPDGKKRARMTARMTEPLRI